MCCTRLAGNARPKKSPKIRHLGTIAQHCPLKSRGTICCKRCKNGSSDRDAVWDMDSGASQEPCIRLGLIYHVWRRCNFEGEKLPAQNMPGYVRRSIYSMWVSRRQHWYADCGVPNVVHNCTLVPPGEYHWTVRVLRRVALCQVTLTTCYYC